MTRARTGRHWPPCTTLVTARLAFDRGPAADLVESIRREPADLVVIDALLAGAITVAERQACGARC